MSVETLTNEDIFIRTEETALELRSLDWVLQNLQSVDGRNQLYRKYDSFIRDKLNPNLFKWLYHRFTGLLIRGYRSADTKKNISTIKREYIQEKLKKFDGDADSFLKERGYDVYSRLVFKAISYLEDCTVDLALSVPRAWNYETIPFDNLAIQVELKEKYEGLAGDINRMSVNNVKWLLSANYLGLSAFFEKEDFTSKDPIVIVEVPDYKRPHKIAEGMSAQYAVSDGKKRILAMAVKGFGEVEAYVGRENRKLEDFERRMKMFFQRLGYGGRL